MLAHSEDLSGNQIARWLRRSRMFIDPALIPRLALQEERNVCGDEYARSATFRSSGARKIFLNLRSINISSLRDESYTQRRTSSQISSKNKKLSVCVAESPRRHAKIFLRGSLGQFFAPFAVHLSVFRPDHRQYHQAARFDLFASLFTLSPYFSSS